MIADATRNGIKDLRKQVVAAGIRGPELAAFDFKMAQFRDRFIAKATPKLEQAMLDLGKDLMSELEAEFGRIVRH